MTLFRTLGNNERRSCINCVKGFAVPGPNYLEGVALFMSKPVLTGLARVCFVLTVLVVTAFGQTDLPRTTVAVTYPLEDTCRVVNVTPPKVKGDTVNEVLVSSPTPAITGMPKEDKGR